MKVDLGKQVKKKLLGRWGGYHTYLVDDRAVRNSAEYAEEFSDYGVNIGAKGLPTLNFRFIPKNEIWIGQCIKPFERKFVIDNVLAYIKNIERGMTPGKAYDKALAYEQTSRLKGALKCVKPKQATVASHVSIARMMKRLYTRTYGVIRDGRDTVKIYLVNGELVRELYKTDYVEGGHGYVYAWIPKDEIWIDRTIKGAEIPVIVLHEFTERTLMKYRKFTYNRAHEAASKVEFEHRGIFGKQDIPHLSRAVVMKKLLAALAY